MEQNRTDDAGPDREEAGRIMAQISVGDEIRYLSDGEICEVQDVTGDGAETHAEVLTNGTRHQVCINDVADTKFSDPLVEVLR